MAGRVFSESRARVGRRGLSSRILLCFAFSFFVVSCSRGVAVPFSDRSGRSVEANVLGDDPGTLVFDHPLELRQDTELELELSLPGELRPGSAVVLSLATGSRKGPFAELARLDVEILTLLSGPGTPPRVRLVSPPAGPGSRAVAAVRVRLVSGEGDVTAASGPAIVGGGLVDPFIGWDRADDGTLRISADCALSRESGGPWLILGSGGGNVSSFTLESGRRDGEPKAGNRGSMVLRFPTDAFRVYALDPGEALNIPSCAVRGDALPLALSIADGAPPASFVALLGPDGAEAAGSAVASSGAPGRGTSATGTPAGPGIVAEPIPLDPGLILAYDRAAWRDSRYEVFSWDRFPSVLIFDTADYAVQDRLFKRLAFFVEKAGFRGRLSSDAEIASLHGWNAHDYRAQDLAAFFSAAARTDFPLSAEERELRGLLLERGIIVDSGGSVTAGVGALVSISRESEDYLRSLFMVHECYHGLFFLDGDFREFAEGQYEALGAPAIEFLTSYFKTRRYDIGDRYLMVNETMAYLLQQPVSAAPRYFGEVLAARLDGSPTTEYRLAPRQDGPVGWPAIGDTFRAAAARFDAYVAQRWGLSAGRIWRVYRDSRAMAR